MKLKVGCRRKDAEIQKIRPKTAKFNSSENVKLSVQIGILYPYITLLPTAIYDLVTAYYQSSLHGKYQDLCKRQSALF